MLQRAYELNLRALTTALESREHGTEHHCERVACYAILLARKMGVDENYIEGIRCGALLHDVGKFLLRGLQPVGNGRSDFAEQDKETVVPPVLEENTVYGIDHCRIGFLLTTYWKLPDEICSTIAYHHHISFANWKDVPSHVRTPVTLVAASDYLANIAGFYEAGPVTYRIPEHIRIFPGFSRPLHTLLEKDLRKDLARTEMLIDQTISES